MKTKFKLNWGVSMAIVYTTFAVIMVILAVKASRIKNDLVTEHYYDEAVKYQDRIDENKNASTAASKLTIVYSTGTKSINLNVSGEVKELSGKLAFYKPDKASDDFSINFKTGENGVQVIPLNELAHGVWRVSANYTVDGMNCHEQARIFVP